MSIYTSPHTHFVYIPKIGIMHTVYTTTTAVLMYIVHSYSHLKAVCCHTRTIEVHTTVTFVLFTTANQYIRRSITSINGTEHITMQYIYMITVVRGHT